MNTNDERLHQVFEYFHYVYGACKQEKMDAQLVLNMLYILINADESLRSLIKKFIYLAFGSIKGHIDLAPMKTVVNAMFDQIPVNVSLGEPSRIDQVSLLECTEPKRLYSLTYKSKKQQLLEINDLMKKLNMVLDDDAEPDFSNQPQTSKRAEGFIIVPKYKILAPQYHVALAWILKVMQKIIPDFIVDPDFDVQRLMCSQDLVQALDYFDKRYYGVFYRLPVQLGLLHNGESVNYAVGTYEKGDYPEFGLDPISGIVAIYLHGDRILGHAPYMTCPGVLYKPPDSDSFSHAIQFAYIDDSLVLRTVSISDHSEDMSVATGFYSS